MSLVQFNRVYKQFAGEYILKDINFTIEAKDKIGLVGLNGAGKSTIIRLLLGKERIDGTERNQNEIGDIIKSPSLKIGYLSQNHEFSDEKNTIYEEMMSVFSEERKIWNELQKINMLLGIETGEDLEKLINKSAELSSLYEAKNGYETEYKIKQILTGLELTEEYYGLYLKDLSGGERTRVSLAKLLLIEPDLLILDEPTNHLDLISIEWLEEYLKRYNKAFLLVSHDRIFLDSVCNKIYEIENKKLYKYDGNFSSFILQKEMILKGEIKRYEKEQEKIRKMEEYIDRFRAGIKARQAKGRQKILDRIERMDDPVFNPRRMKLKFETEGITGDNVLKVKNIEKSFGDKKVLNNISFDLFRGERVGIIGKNGIGKSTLLKIIINKLRQDKGTVEFGSRVKIGYYDQDHQDLHSENNILQEINVSLNLTEEYLRTLAGGFLFSGEEVLKKVEKLSGGEKVRIAFLKLYMKKANFLILDEPTNHLDIYSVEVLEEALEDFDGTMLVVSHNRHFLDSVCNTIYYLDEKGLTKFKGNYEEYRKSLKNNKSNLQMMTDIEVKEERKLSYHEQKELSRKIAKLKREIVKLEEEMERISVQREKLNNEYEDAGKKNDVEKLMEIQEQFNRIDEEEMNKIEEWDMKSKELEKIEKK
ncbi:ABC transporter ATP-binding protein [Leptotrichia sp. OH3620_COT-345]|uniref:ABC-F family ATP-binding cassette domain-containing protein n=1 Tax=Leptotrichia sp. OH3620_COT-345 TaxID=2491048 RepID=UPI000F654752|nr:ABC-F family ATP-binding cassette domain-containing protein [Leptotrichia sp. OH3620_COT-345]RRD38435.1 ABC transporter ATP-binding protein [Leptotrichia sp. OH3620_COT-345]